MLPSQRSRRILLILLIVSAPCIVFAEPPTFEITTKKPEDQVKETTIGEALVFDVLSPSGIGGATITLKKGKWSSIVILRLHLHGLESFAVSNGKVGLSASVLSHNGETKRLALTEDGRERDPGTEIRVLDAAGKPVKGMPDQGGYFEVKLPKALFISAPKNLTLGWIDFFRR